MRSVRKIVLEFKDCVHLTSKMDSSSISPCRKLSKRRVLAQNRNANLWPGTVEKGVEYRLGALPGVEYRLGALPGVEYRQAWLAEYNPLKVSGVPTRHTPRGGVTPPI